MKNDELPRQARDKRKEYTNGKERCFVSFRFGSVRFHTLCIIMQRWGLNVDYCPAFITEEEIEILGAMSGEKQVRTVLTLLTKF